MITEHSKPLFAALLTVVLWAFAFPASKAALPFFTAEEIVLLRYLVACIFYLILFVMGYCQIPKLKDIPALLLLGILGVTIYQLLFVYGIGRVTAGATAMIIAANPVFSSLLARFFLGEKLNRYAWIGIGISLSGVSLIALVKGTDGDLPGYLMLIGATTAMSIYFVFQKPFFKRYTPVEMTFYTAIAGTLPLLYLLPDAWAALTIAPQSALISIFLMGVFSSGVGFILWFYALSKTSAGIVTSFLFLQPVFVTALSWYWLEEFPGVQTFVGGGIVLVGVALILISRSRAKSH